MRDLWLLKSVRWFILVTFLALSYLQLDTGLADNGDFTRVINLFSPGPEGFFTNWPDPASEEWQYRFTNYWIPFWKLSFLPRYNWFSSVLLIWIPGIIANCIFFSKTTLFLPMVSLLPRILSFLLIWKLLRYIDSRSLMPIVLYFSLVLPLSLILINTDYIAYFNSFYQETASIVFLFLVLFSLNDYRCNSNSISSILLLAFSVFCLTTAKLSFFYIPVLILPFVLWKRLLNNANPIRYLTMILLAIITPLLCASILVLNNPYAKYNAFHRLYNGVLTFSENPESHLRDLGMEDGTNYLNTSGWSKEGAAFIERYKDKLTYQSFLRVLMKEPKILLKSMKYTSNNMQLITISYLGKTRRNSANISNARILTLWSVIKSSIFPRGVWFFIFIAFASIVFYFNVQSNSELISVFSYSGLFCTVICLFDMIVAILGEGKGELHKHLLLSNLSFDITFLLFVSILLLIVMKRLCLGDTKPGLHKTTRWN